MINKFLNKSDEEQMSIVIDVLKKDYAHNFSEDRTFKYKDIAKYTLKLMNTYGYFNEDNPLLMSECNEFKICFQPNFKGKKRLDRIIVYFAHMITGDKGSLRVLDIEKARTIDYLMKVLQSPTKMYYQNGRNSFLFERQILLNESHQNCHMVLYIEKIKSNMMRVVTILPNVNKSRTKMQKENNSITEISSFHQLRHFISPSVGEDFGNGGEILTNNNTNIQNKLIECMPEDEIILKLTENQQDNFLNKNKMTQETIEKIEKLEKAINSPATPENIKETMRKALETLKSQNAEVVIETPTDKKYSNIKSCLLDDGDDSDDYIYEGKLIHNVEVLPKDTWEIVEFYKYGAVLKHIPTSVLADSKPNKNVSLEELKSLFASDKIEIDGIEKGNTKVFNLCIKAIIKCIDSLDMAAYKENLLAELNASKNELEKTIEASNLLAYEKSNLEKETSDKIQSLESDIAAKSISMEEATRLKEEETAKLKKQLEDLEALNAMRTLIDMLGEDIAKKDFKETPSIESNGKVKVKEIRLFAAEGKVSGYGFPKVVNTYEEANDAVMPVYEDAIESNYANKCRFTVTFEDGETYDGDLLVSEKYDNPTKGNVIGKHIKDYLEREIKEDRQSEETKKEIIEFLEKYDLGFDNHVTSISYDSSYDFFDYVNDFYGKDGVYAKDFSNNGFTKDEIKEAISRYKKDISEINSDEFSWGGGDSLDRERVRGYLEEMLVNEKYREGDFVFADIFKDKNKKVPFVVSHYSNGKYYILGDGSHYVSETRLSPATEKDFDDYYGESAKSFKSLNNSIIDSDFNLLGNPKEPYLLTPEQFSNLIEEKNKILGRDYAKLKPLFEKYSVIKNGYDKIKEDVFSNPLLAYYIAHKSESGMGYADTSHIDKNKIKTENAKYLIDNIDKYPSNNEFKKHIKLIYFANQKSNENHKNIVEDALRLTYKGGETAEQSKSDYKRAIENGEVNLDDVLFILKESKVKPTSEIANYKYENGGGISNERFIFGIEYKDSPTSRVFKKSSLTMVGRDTKEMNDAINENANLLKKQEGWHDFKITKTPIMENGGSINDKVTSKAKHEIDFLTKKGYDIDVYSTLNQDAIFGGEKTDDFIIATQGSIGTGKDVKFAIAYWYKDEEDGEMQISRALLDEISDLFKGSPVVLYTNAGVDLHSITEGKHKNIQVVKVPYGEFSGNSDEYSYGGSVEKELKGYRVNIYKSGNDTSSQNVVSTKFDKIILVTDGIKGDSSSVMSNEPYIKLVKRNLFGKEVLSAEPVNFGVDNNHKMFGGTFVWSSDSRFRDDISERPIPLHDRVEAYEKGGEVENKEYAYMMLGRLKMDNDAYLDGTRTENRLWAINIYDQIEEMKKLWNGLPSSEKPEWLSMEDILDYEVKMKEKYKKSHDFDSIMQEYKELTRINNHDEAAILLAENFGTVEELNKLKTIQKANEKRGYSIDSDRKEMDAIANKYYYYLKKITDIPTVSMSRVKSDFVKEPQIFQGNVVSIGENKFKIEDGILYIKKLNSDWEKFRRINY